MKALIRLMVVWSAGLGGLGVAASPPSIAEFASRPVIEDVSISPDGHRLAVIRTAHGRAEAVVIERDPATHAAPLSVLSEPENVRMTWCRWATNGRLLCGFRGIDHGRHLRGITRLVGVDADGRNVRVLVQNSFSAQGQFQDRVIDWNPGPADTVLVEADEGLSEAQQAGGVRVYGHVGTTALPAVFELNVLDGRLSVRQHARDPIRHWVTDHRGQVRLGYGLSGPIVSYYARLDRDTDWRRLTRFEAFSNEQHVEPIAIDAEDPNKAYAFADHEGRRALWLIDLTDKDPPRLLFAHPTVDVGNPVLSHDNRLLGVRYDAGYPMTYYTDDAARILNHQIQDLRPGQFSVEHGSSADGNTHVFRSYSDRDAASFLVYDSATSTTQTLGDAYPGRDTAALAVMRPISYPARDGTSIPGFLSVPPGAAGENLPLVVLPHGGPISRDGWGYSFLRQFLVSRGFAVLQMNFRGSGGYGRAWQYAAHQDWGGLTYQDVVDGARWAVQQKIADPRRLGIVGWNFGGYLALVGAQRNPDVFRCAVDIGGVSDLAMFIDERWYTLGKETIKQEIGTDSGNLQRNSPRLHAAEFAVPVLMIHGTDDVQIPVAQSQAMDRALQHAGKAHRFVEVRDGDSQFDAEKDRALLLREMDAFLGEHLGSGSLTPLMSSAPSSTTP